jgi:hypothetical protein
LTSGQLQVTSPLTLTGQKPASTVITANLLSRVFDVTPAGDLTVRDVTLTGGYAPNGAASTGTAPGTDGGSGGAVLNEGSLTLDAVIVSGSAAGNGGDGHFGGNTPGNAPGAGGSGGAIASTGPSLTIANSTIVGNVAGTGGGGAGGSPTGGLGGRGGGLSLAGPATLTNDTITGNSAGHMGQPLPASGDLTAGAAVSQDGGTVTMVQVTIAGNLAITNTLTCCHDIESNGGKMTIADSALEATCSPGVTNGGYNVASPAGFGNPQGQCPDAVLALPVTAEFPSPTLGPYAFNLGPLRDNGGPTPTMLPGTGPHRPSSLIGEVPAVGWGCQPTDQRGVPRPQQTGYCDAGAVETRVTSVTVSPPVVGPPPPSVTVSARRLTFRHVRRETLRIKIVGVESGVVPQLTKITGRNARDFRVVRSDCGGRTLVPGDACMLTVAFDPHGRGVRTATESVSGYPVIVRLVGTGVRAQRRH